MIKCVTRILAVVCVLKIAYDGMDVHQQFQSSIFFMDATGDTPSLPLASNPNNAKEGLDKPRHQSTRRLPLSTIVRANERVECPEGLFPVQQVVNVTAESIHIHNNNSRKIPQIVHMTGESNCLTEIFYQNTKDWSLPGHSFYFHDGAAKQKLLLERYWPEFPHLQLAFQCLKNAGGAAVADLWRYLVLWEYGGIYTDMDNQRGPLFDADSIGAHVDAYFLRVSQSTSTWRR